ncbi:Synaptobrevin family protein [Trichomonas vaginalis G3]|uniref:Synaptobrevin family protein n=1 Tax=Trichomonas vaginalis (strain ATCC PRA-98 / G3) TaxID=412133 RepID=A2DAC8_TRIV3|nr:SNAP receptor protein [Trichomonas vaginalis G3]EAY22776.1 Synaptobrevin family protein [Trichomonas vaginalis G3]KAI5525587.1 SNAP receptor protein [Trichomonas vaginalis G3]|eukprot:XP_001583762.1 Synaptobrevin family protein [Trichomonas vaginalis G3]
MTTNFFYACVAKGAAPLAEFSTVTGNQQSIAIKMLENVDPKKPSTILEEGDYIYQVLADPDRMNFLCLAKKTATFQLRQTFLEELQRKWRVKYKNQGSSFEAYSKSKEFGPDIQSLFTQYNSERAAKIAAIKSNIAATQEKMAENLTQALIRGEKLDVMEEKSNSIKEHAEVFHRAANKVKNRMCFEHYKWYIIGGIIGAVFLAGVIIVIVIMTKK